MGHKKAVKRKVKKMETGLDLIMPNNIVALVAIALFIGVIAVNYAIYAGTAKYSNAPAIQGQVTGSVRFCINTPPNTGNSCPTHVNVSSSYYCNISASDDDGHNITYYDSTGLYNVTELGVISFIPSISDLGQFHTIVTIADNSSCSNANTSKDVNFSICLEPTWDNFRNYETTNLTLFDCWNNVADFRLGMPNMASINFTEDVGIDGYDFDSYANLSRNFMNINITYLPGLMTGARITFYNLTLESPTIIHDGEVCSMFDCIALSLTNTSITFFVFELSGSYYVTEQNTIQVYDDTRYYVRYSGEQVKFYANYTYMNNQPLTGADCNLSFYSSGAYDAGRPMEYNDTTKVYEYSRNFSRPGNYTYRINCSITGSHANDTSFATITNRPPVLANYLPNETWNQNTILTGRDLDDYFMDPDGDNLTYTYTALANIVISINPTTHVITLTPDPAFYGNESVYYIATDNFAAKTTSNLVGLTVIQVIGAYSPGPEVVPGGGGGGGGSAALIAPCTEEWKCDEWGPCLPTFIQVRQCTEMNIECKTTLKKPELSRECSYFPTCTDRIKNGNEEGVDCGGPVCPACANCFDGIQNQGEEGVDCGGPCDRCASCRDGFRNGNEEGVDCGGRCAACPSCYDEIQNQHETGIDCGGECPVCPNCGDGTRNGGEEGIDCGGPCQPCGFFEARSPGRVSFFAISLMLVLVLIAIYVMNRKRIDKFVTEARPFAMPVKKKKVKKQEYFAQLEKDYISKIAVLEQKVQLLDSKSIIEMLNGLFSRIVSDLLGIGYEASYDELRKEMSFKKMDSKKFETANKFMKEMEELKFSTAEIDKNRVLALLKESKAVVHAVEETAMKYFALGLESMEMIIDQVEKLIAQNSPTEEIREHYGKLMQKYKMLSAEDKKKYYDKIMSIGLELNKKMKMEKMM